MMSRSPDVTAIAECLGSRPVANALGAGSLMMYTLGMGMPVVIARFSTVFQSRGFCSR